MHILIVTLPLSLYRFHSYIHLCAQQIFIRLLPGHYDIFLYSFMHVPIHLTHMHILLIAIQLCIFLFIDAFPYIINTHSYTHDRSIITYLFRYLYIHLYI